MFFYFVYFTFFTTSFQFNLRIGFRMVVLFFFTLFLCRLLSLTQSQNDMPAGRTNQLILSNSYGYFIVQFAMFIALLSPRQHVCVSCLMSFVLWLFRNMLLNQRKCSVSKSAWKGIPFMAIYLVVRRWMFVIANSFKWGHSMAAKSVQLTQHETVITMELLE